MSDLSIVFGANEVLTHGNLNQVLQELEGFSRAVAAHQLLGGITLDKLADNAALSWMYIEVLPTFAPYTSTEGTGAAVIANDLSNAAARGFILPSAWTRMKPLILPVIKPGWECDLCAYWIHVEAFDEGADTDASELRIRRNDTVTIGSAETALNIDDNTWIIANSDPVANPVSPLADGDYLSIEMRSPSGTPRPRGVGVTLAFRHTLIAG